MGGRAAVRLGTGDYIHKGVAGAESGRPIRFFFALFRDGRDGSLRDLSQARVER